MPYKDPEKRKQKSREWSRDRYASDPVFRERAKLQRREYGKKKYAEDPAFRTRVLASRKETARRTNEDPQLRADALIKRRAWANGRSPQTRMYNSAKQRARVEGAAFEITAEDIWMPPLCPILLIPLVPQSGSHADNSPSLDRIDPRKGYIKGNIAVISYRANRLKNDGTAEEHEAIARFIRERT